MMDDFIGLIYAHMYRNTEMCGKHGYLNTSHKFLMLFGLGFYIL